MEKENGTEIGKIITFFISALLVNYVLGNFYDAFVVRDYAVSFGAFLGLDAVMSKHFALLFFGIYAFAYVLVTTWFLRNVFGITKTFILNHTNAILGFLVLIGIIWTKGYNVANPSFFITYLPIVSFGLLFFGQIFSRESIFSGETRVSDTKSFISSIREDVEGANAGVSDLLASFKTDVERTKQPTLTPFQKTEPSSTSDDGFENAFDRFKNFPPSIHRGNEGDDGYIDAVEEPIGKSERKQGLDDEFFNPKDLKGILKGNRERLASPDTETVGTEEPIAVSNPSDPNFLSEDGDESRRGNDERIPDEYISVVEFDEEDAEIEPSYPIGEDSTRIEKTSDMGNTMMEDSSGSRDSEKEISDEDFYAVGFVTNSDLALLSDLMKKL